MTNIQQRILRDQKELINYGAINIMSVLLLLSIMQIASCLRCIVLLLFIMF